MITRLSNSQLLAPDDVTPSRDEFEVIGVFNPGAIQMQDDIVMLVRVAEKPIEVREGFLGLPRWTLNGETEIDWVHQDDWIAVDPRVVRSKKEGSLRLTSISHLRVIRLIDGKVGRGSPWPWILPEHATEEFGIEDPRISKIDQTYWISYVAVSRLGAATALLSSKDMVTFQRHGLIFCAENKDVLLFPQQVDGQYLTLHRPNPNSHFSPPSIWLAQSPDLLHWGGHRNVYQGIAAWEADRVGGGTPPILIDEGWLHLYHGSCRSQQVGHVGEYAVGALLLDRENPAKVLARSAHPIMRPLTEFERHGFVPGVVFPTAAILQEDRIHVFYGAADTSIGVVEFATQDIVNALS